ncbi:hypothetical protein AKO1_008248 [Acrasis kona]|uniref:Rab-GAP TBC domain-containing protein n=1 Tax=Acrasis kona TaxID=1008807 RepID=A0AAW2YP43_9EUKA
MSTNASSHNHHYNYVAVPSYMPSTTTPNSPFHEHRSSPISTTTPNTTTSTESIEEILRDSRPSLNTAENQNQEQYEDANTILGNNARYSSLVHVTGDMYRKRSHSNAHHNSPYPWTSFENLLTKNDKNKDYQKGRVALFRKLLIGYPETRFEIVREARADIPGVLRGEIWAAILGVEQDLEAKKLYDLLLNKMNNTARRNGRWMSAECEASDRQIAVDVPRCHQYNKLLASKTGHAKLTRVLRAWVVDHDTSVVDRVRSNSNPHAPPEEELLDDAVIKKEKGPLVYWQGLDSLTAPFVVLNFHFEARAFCCIRALVDKFVKGFFAKDNSHAMEERLATFQKLLIYHDPELGLHLRNIGFSAELYAIPWFLTLFAHVLPIEKIFKLWDALLLSSSSHHLPMFLAIGMMKQLRGNLLKSDFNTAMTLFQNMQGIDIRRAINDADGLVDKTPKSMLVCSRTMSIQSYSDKLCPRLGAKEFDQVVSKVAMIIDVRKYSDYESHHYAMAHHVSSFLDDPRLYTDDVKSQQAIEESIVTAVKCKQGLPIVLIGRDDCRESCKQLERMEKVLVLEQVPYVCVVDGGMEAIRRTM